MPTYSLPSPSASTASKHSLTYHLRNNPSLLKSLGLTCVRVWDLLQSMGNNQARKSRNGERYSYPRQQWIADELGVCRKTVNEACQKLKAAGLLYIHHCFSKAHRQLSNLYATGLTMWECLRGLWGSGRTATKLSNPEVTPDLRSRENPTLKTAQGVPEAHNPEIEAAVESLKSAWEAHRQQSNPS